MYSLYCILGKAKAFGPPPGAGGIPPLPGPKAAAGGAPPAPGFGGPDGKSPLVGDLMLPESIDMVELISTFCPPNETLKPSVYVCCSLLGMISLHLV